MLLCSIDFAVDPRTNEDANSTCSDTEEGKLYNNIPLGTLSCIDTLFFITFTESVPREKQVSLKTVLAFFTGADSIPPLGYQSAVLNFNPHNPYPMASTCAIQLTLPTKYQDYDEFQKHLNIGFSMHGGFGLK